ncbi:tRNA uridine-5-carboxymethylaminomethyl(34) synthesis GTPase MnmE [Acidocella sp.]|uniref:tRNA uridine-5-carboxymethylaminomethyl(34) synthesis GTPase MnmE n=2 Tax=Acidocella sp. TaxID=50710 RepID=UPI00260C2679|nr:tRNA uridine-5-carboxymethylaminomethyl(34) synthesis GTPase MnmE [Acidocella sp.]
MSTIFAPVTGRGGAVTMLRLSGPAALGITRALAGALPAPRRASLRRLRHGGLLLDQALVVTFPAPHSFTGEDCAELSLHGGRAVLAAVSGALTALGARYAEPGEFSRRAFENGRLDLLEAEAMADLIAAETEAQRRLAVAGADALHQACASWRERLRQLMARQEALIDFPDEDLPPEVDAALSAGIAALRDEMYVALAAAPAAERLREGLEFVILGPPNAGKSTLLNALAGEEIAIVSEAPGTTRDALGVRLDLGGVPVHLTDTAGLRDTADAIEAEGVRRARARAARADFLLLVAGPGDDFAPAPENIPHLRLRTKADLGGPGLSARTGAGMVELRARLAEAARELTDTKGGAALARPRQIACVRDTAAALGRALELSEPELRGEELRLAAAALARLVGGIAVEEVLDAVFSGFCIGK